MRSSARTETADLHGIHALIPALERCFPHHLGVVDTASVLYPLAVERRTSASTQNQALCAILSLDKRVLELELPALEGLERAQRLERLPAVLSRRDAFATVDHRVHLIGELLDGSGLRLLECLRIRVKDIRTTRISTPIVDRGPLGVLTPQGR